MLELGLCIRVFGIDDGIEIGFPILGKKDGEREILLILERSELLKVFQHGAEELRFDGRELVDQVGGAGIAEIAGGRVQELNEAAG